MFIAAFSQYLSYGNSQDAPPTNKLIKKMWYLYSREFYSATKKNEFLSLQVNG
jgi:hypothetical protein